MTLPVVVIGNSLMKATSRGYSCAESRVRTKSRTSPASASEAVEARLEHDECLDDLGAHRIRLADHGRERDRRMLDQAVLDLARPDAVAGGGDDVVVAPHEGDVALVVDDALVAGGHPVADEFLARRLGPAPVFEEHHRVRPLHGDHGQARPRPRASRPRGSPPHRGRAPACRWRPASTRRSPRRRRARGCTRSGRRTR